METVADVMEEDLGRLYFRVKDAQGTWATVNARDASPAAFDHWARSLVKIAGGPLAWRVADRLDFVNWCQSHGVRFAFVTDAAPPVVNDADRLAALWRARKTG